MSVQYAPSDSEFTDYDLLSDAEGAHSLESSIADLDLQDSSRPPRRDVTETTTVRGEPAPSAEAITLYETPGLSAADIQRTVRVTARPGLVRVYVDGVFDGITVGTVHRLRQAKLSFPNVHLLVGLFDATAADTAHVLPLTARAEVIRHLRWVDAVLPDPAPTRLDEAFLNRWRIDFVAIEEGASVDPTIGREQLKGYDLVKSLGKAISTRRTRNVPVPVPHPQVVSTSTPTSLPIPPIQQQGQATTTSTPAPRPRRSEPEPDVEVARAPRPVNIKSDNAKERLTDPPSPDSAPKPRIFVPPSRKPVIAPTPRTETGHGAQTDSDRVLLGKATIVIDAGKPVSSSPRHGIEHRHGRERTITAPVPPQDPEPVPAPRAPAVPQVVVPQLLTEEDLNSLWALEKRTRTERIYKETAPAGTRVREGEEAEEEDIPEPMEGFLT